MRTFPSYDETLALLPGPRTTIGPEHTDPNGHLNVRHYLALFDDAEWSVYDDIGAGAAATQEGVGGLFALEQHLSYRREVLEGEEVSVQVRLLARTEKLLHLTSYLVNHATGEVAAAMEALCAYVSYTTRRSSPIPADAAEAIDRVVAEHAALPWQVEASQPLGLRA